MWRYGEYKVRVFSIGYSVKCDDKYFEAKWLMKSKRCWKCYAKRYIWVKYKMTNIGCTLESYENGIIKVNDERPNKLRKSVWTVWVSTCETEWDVRLMKIKVKGYHDVESWRLW